MKKEDLSLEITSCDNYIVKMPTSYKLIKTATKKENKIVNSFKNSILGTDIGINSEGFSYIAILATILAVGAFITMYLSWRI